MKSQSLLSIFRRRWPMAILIASSLAVFISHSRANSMTLPAKPDTAVWLAWAESQNFDDPTFEFPETAGSTSCALVIRQNGKRVGTFFPPNSSANPKSEAGYPALARVLGRDELVRMAIPQKLGPRAISRFAELMREGCQKNKWQRANRRRLLDMIAVDPNSLAGVFKRKNADGVVAADDLLRNGRPVLTGRLFSLVQPGAPRPDASRMVEYKGHKRDEVSIARELSIALTLDVVFGQFDRYSGGNFTLLLDGVGVEKRVSVHLSDNGGAGLSKSNAESSARVFGRYDRDVLGVLYEFSAFLTGARQTFLGFTDVGSLLGQMGLAPSDGPRLVTNIEILRTTSEANARRYGEAAVYF